MVRLKNGGGWSATKGFAANFDGHISLEFAAALIIVYFNCFLSYLSSLSFFLSLLLIFISGIKIYNHENLFIYIQIYISKHIKKSKK